MGLNNIACKVNIYSKYGTTFKLPVNVYAVMSTNNADLD